MTLMSRSFVADNIRAELARRRKTQADLAGLLNLTHQSMSRRMRGQVAFRDHEVIQIAAYLGVDVSLLFTAVA
jgi:transcriptional regulator with XRE-family HTH domain